MIIREFEITKKKKKRNLIKKHFLNELKHNKWIIIHSFSSENRIIIQCLSVHLGNECNNYLKHYILSKRKINCFRIFRPEKSQISKFHKHSMIE